MDFLTASFGELKAYCQSNGITPVGNKTLKATWRDAAIEFYQATIEPTVNELFEKADAIGAKYQDPEEVLSTAIELVELTIAGVAVAAEVAKTIAVKTFEVATSERAIALYRRAAYIAALVVVILVCISIAIGKFLSDEERIIATTIVVSATIVIIPTIARSRSIEFWAWLRSKFETEYQNLINVATVAYLGLLE